MPKVSQNKSSSTSPRRSRSQTNAKPSPLHPQLNAALQEFQSADPPTVGRWAGQMLYDLALQEPENLVGGPSNLGQTILRELFVGGEVNPDHLELCRILQVRSMTNGNALHLAIVIARAMAVRVLEHASQGNPDA